MKTLPHSSAVGCLVPSHAASCDADLGVLMREADLTLVTGFTGGDNVCSVPVVSCFEVLITKSGSSQ